MVENQQAVLSILLPEITSSSLKNKVSKTTPLGKMQHIVILVLYTGVLQWQLTFSSKLPCHMLSKVLLFKGILWFHTAIESQYHLAIVFSHRGSSHFSIPSCTMPAAQPKLTGKYISFCLKKLPRERRSPWPRITSLYVFSYADQRLIAFVTVQDVSAKATYYRTTA